MEDRKNDDLNKKVDEVWKDAVERDKTASENKLEVDKMPEVTFGLFVSGLMMEALVALGEVDNPVTKKKEFNVHHAKFIIDTLDMLKDKTNNNLSKDESDSLDAVLYDLRMRFVGKAKK